MGLVRRVELGRERKEPFLQKAEYFWPITLSETHVLSCCCGLRGDRKSQKLESLRKRKVPICYYFPAHKASSIPAWLCVLQNETILRGMCWEQEANSGMFPVNHPARAQ